MKSRTMSGNRRQSMPEIMEYDQLLAGLGEKDRAGLERQLAAYAAKLGEAQAVRWRRLLCVLRTLSPGPVKLASANAMQFFIPDGKYRKQVFAMQAMGDGSCAVYAPDVISEAVRSGLLSKPSRVDDRDSYRVSKSVEMLSIDSLDGKTPNPDAFYKDMTGWNRKAIRMTLPAEASDAQVHVVEQICVLAAEEWATTSE